LIVPQVSLVDTDRINPEYAITVLLTEVSKNGTAVSLHRQGSMASVELYGMLLGGIAPRI
jgi:hypothetical protein